MIGSLFLSHAQEWNPPLHEPHMREAITREPGGESVPIRVIHVPTSIHMSMPHHKAGGRKGTTQL